MKRTVLGLHSSWAVPLVAGRRGATLIAAAASGGAGATPVCPSIGSGSGCAYRTHREPRAGASRSPPVQARNPTTVGAGAKGTTSSSGW